MAEYIDRVKTQAYLYNNMMWYDEEGYIAEDSEKDKALWDLVNGVPTTDVIERSKIDKAIDELRKEIEENHLNVIEYADGEWIVKDFVYGAIERFKRNIGE